jgi:hypothetical protein
MRYLWGMGLGIALAAGIARAEDAPAESGSLESLMAGMREIRGESARFVELKTVRLLTRPIRATGTLTYAAPDKLEKITLTPTPETIRLEGGMLSGTRADGEEFSVDIDSHEEIAALVEGIRSTLAGDLATLQRHYEITFSGDGQHWKMDLAPKARRVREKVDTIRIQGSGTAIGTIVVSEKDGDRSEMTITPDTP